MSPNEPFRSSYRGVPAGTRLNGIYEIDEMIGAGGMGEVYKCREIQTGAPIAIKMLLPDMAENEAALALFRREAAALHNLPHEAIVRYFLFTVEPVLQRPYLAMEFVDGRSLSDILAEGPLTFEAMVKLMRRVASGLQAAHERGIIHRDVSPDNIIIPLGDVTRAKIIDFGIARSTQVGDKTIIGNGFAGKDNYVSPEQVGLFNNDVTAKSDIYSLGLVLFHVLTGQKLDMGGSQYQLVEKRRRVPDLGAIDMRIRPLLEQMLQPDPAQRPASMADIANWTIGSPRSFNPMAAPDAAAAQPAAPSQPVLARILGNRGVRLGAAVVGVAALLGLGGYGFYEFVWSTPPAAIPPPSPVFGQTTPPAKTDTKSDTTKTATKSDGKSDAKSETKPETKSNPAVVKSPPPVTPPSGDLAGRPDRIRKYVEQYDGGDCFFILPVAVTQSAAVIEGFGASTVPFDTFDRAFKRDQGFEATVGVRQVTQAQCPAVKFLSQLGSQARAPRINLTSTELKSGETLNGTIENFANRVVELLLVSDRGEVQSLSYLLKQGTDSLSFSIGGQRGGSGSGPQLLMAVTTPRVLDSLRQPRPLAADMFFLQALSEAQRNNVTMATSARYFQIKN
ncbi:serine/threonine-protein kinase [Bradyrhizobium prioriisuperbiae]|uniref:serine/threonine-protein kinase n=1 Tax=Bradyrhizobium prioriisuperbiae TaxID=2854389 RepID=UPI0028E7E05E|nr:serine/threonine-protein kinase [Bradyrhizobium prioritasuperba]